MVPPEETADGTSLAGFGTNLDSAQVQGVCVMRAVRLAATRRFQLMGWTDGDWARVYRTTERYEANVLWSRRKRPSGTA
jgi:hypothetical protein